MSAVCPVLCYHAITDDPGDPAERLHAVHPETLHAQLDWLRRRFEIVPLAELAQRDSWTGLAAVTFDDGFRSAIETGWPVLRDLGLPATFFLIGEALATGTFWRERVRSAIRHGLQADFLAWAGDAPAAAGIRAERFYKDSKSPARDIPALDRLLADFLAARGIGFEGRCLDEPAKLPREPGFATGNHSARHYVAAALNREGQSREVLEGQRALAARGIADHPFYAIPFGGTDDFGPATLGAAKAAGYAGVLLSRGALNGAAPTYGKDGLLLVERLMPADDPGDLGVRIG